MVRAQVQRYIFFEGCNVNHLFPSIAIGQLYAAQDVQPLKSQEVSIQVTVVSVPAVSEWNLVYQLGF